MEIASLNVGTGTVKASRHRVTERGLELLDRRTLPRVEGRSVADLCAESLRLAGADRSSVRAVGHRIVHGGTDLLEPVVIDARIEAKLEELVPLAPLHLPAALAGLRAARNLLPNRTMVGVFDTAFHAGRPEVSKRYALPWRLSEELGLSRYGFHGIAHAALSEAFAIASGLPTEEVDAVTLQLGSGCSACAIRGGLSIETSMGFSPLDGLVMPTRAGDVSAGVILHLLRHGFEADEIDDLLHRRSGLLGMAGSADVRTVLDRQGRGDPNAAAALDLFIHRIVAVVGSHWTLLGGRGALVFGGGIGSHSPEIRRRVVQGLSEAWNVALDESANARGAGRISAPGSRPVFVFETDEESQMARSVSWLVGEKSASGEAQ